MAQLPKVYNTADLPDTGGPAPLIPPGQYKAVAVDSGLKDTAKKDGQFLWIKFVITEGQYRDTEFTERLNIINPNQTAVDIAYKTLARISEAVGMTQTPQDSNQLHNKPLVIEIATEAGKPWRDRDGVEREGKDKSYIKAYHKGSGGLLSGNVGFQQQAATMQADANNFARSSAMPWDK